MSNHAGSEGRRRVCQARLSPASPCPPAVMLREKLSSRGLLAPVPPSIPRRDLLVIFIMIMRMIVI